MKQQFLHENWEMRQIGNDEFLPAAVPGSVYGDLLSNGKMETRSGKTMKTMPAS